MTRLLGVELRRVASRRLVLALMLLPLAFVALALVGIHLDLSSAEANRAEAERFYEQALDDWEENGAEMVADCQKAQERERELSGDPSLDFGCDQMREPVLADFMLEPPPVGEQLLGAVAALGVPVAVLALLIGATLTGAEFSARTIGTWLTFEPRRGRVWGSKTLAAAVGVLPMAGAVLAALTVAVPLVYRVNGDPASLTASAWSEVAATGARAVVLIVLAAALGAGLGMLLRNTGAVFGVLVAYALVVEGLVQGFWPRVQPYLLTRNAEAWLRGGLEWTDLECSPSAEVGQECVEVVRTVSLPDASLVLGGVLAVVLLLSWAHFRHSDID